ncbi:MAG: ATP-binding cassette domain-containing protein [Candidatus Moranbacteria bacterium]|nr:ATP-binding cassette domain-containing protein [Candidatus Moranbacteria bacterium]
MLTVKNIRKMVGGQRVLNKASFSLGEGQKAALVGLNGVGKSTLLRIVSGIESADQGSITKPNRVLMGYLPQEAVAEEDLTIEEYLRHMAGLAQIEEELDILKIRLDEPEAQEEYDVLMTEFERLGGYEFERRMQRVITGLRIKEIDKTRSILTLSGGERRKIALAGVLLRGVDMLLLDEPTNNLDMPALLFLENWLKQNKKTTCLIASHDRRFLDAVVTKVIEIDWYRRDTQIFTGNWSQFEEVKEHARRSHNEQYRLQEEERARLTESKAQKIDWVTRVWDKKKRDHDKMVDHFKKERAAKKFSASARALEGREKRMTKIEKLVEREPLELDFYEPEEVLAKMFAVDLNQVTVGYLGAFSVGPIDWHISYGEKIALLGDNGAGKTTLLRAVTGDLAPLSGEVAIGEEVKIGYLIQEHDLLLQNENLKLEEYLKSRLPHELHERIPTLIGIYQLSPLFLSQKMKHLSPGERMRVLLLILVEQKANFLLLDEPTNHLDLESIQAFEEAVNAFPGTVIVVTHDRMFLEAIDLTQVAVLRDGQLEIEMKT